MPLTRLLGSETSFLLVVDVQEKFLPVLPDSSRLVSRVRVLVQAAGLLGIPVVVSEQYPKGLGSTAAPIREACHNSTHFHEKTAFGCLADENLNRSLRGLQRKQVLLCGVEAHVCVSQTAHQLLEEGFQVHLAQDAIASRSTENCSVAIAKMHSAGAVPSSVEIALFEWLRGAGHPLFKQVQALVK